MFDKEVEVVLDKEEDEFPDKEEAVVLYKEAGVGDIIKKISAAVISAFSNLSANYRYKNKTKLA